MSSCEPKIEYAAESLKGSNMEVLAMIDSKYESNRKEEKVG